ncbi:MAG: RDD family protein [bacterium]
MAARLGAYVLDSVASIFVAALFVSNRDLPGVAGRLPGAWSLVPFALDYLVGLTLGGQTLGMRLVSIRVVRVDRPVPIGLTRVVIRTALLMLFIPALIFDRDNRGLHDRVTDTATVRA